MNRKIKKAYIMYIVERKIENTKSCKMIFAENDQSVPLNILCFDCINHVNMT